MKYACIIIFFFSLSCACRSSKQTNRQTIQQTHDETKNKQVRIEQSTLDTGFERSQSAANVEVRNIRTITFAADGTVSSIQNERRTTGSVQLVKSRERSAGVSLKQLEDSTTTTQKQQLQEKENTKAQTDSRPIQGAEWLWLTIPATLLLLIIFSIVFIYFKRK